MKMLCNSEMGFFVKKVLKICTFFGNFQKHIGKLRHLVENRQMMQKKILWLNTKKRIRASFDENILKVVKSIFCKKSSQNLLHFP